MIVVYTRSRERIEVPNGAAVIATELPTQLGNDRAKALAIVAATGETLAVSRVVEVSGLRPECKRRRRRCLKRAARAMGPGLEDDRQLPGVT